MLPFAPEGYPFVLVPALAGIVAWAFGAPAVAAVCWVAMLACVAFFRDPARVSTAPPEAVLAPADGKVLSVGNAPAAMAGIGLPQQISIFMSPANVHVNRAPISARCATSIAAGAKLPAFGTRPRNSTSTASTPRGCWNGCVQTVAGSLARGVVCDLSPGQTRLRGVSA
jgi:phosphatidylserine decarboxylase